MHNKKKSNPSVKFQRRLLIDVQYFIFKLSSLDGCDGPGNHLEVVVNNTKIKDRRQVQQRSSDGPTPTLLNNAGSLTQAAPQAHTNTNVPVTAPQPTTPPTGATGLSVKSWNNWKSGTTSSTPQAGGTSSPALSNSDLSQDMKVPSNSVLGVNPSPSPSPSTPVGNNLPAITTSLQESVPAFIVPSNNNDKSSQQPVVTTPTQTPPIISTTKSSAGTSTSAGGTVPNTSWTAKSSYYRNAFGGMFARSATNTSSLSSAAASSSQTQDPTETITVPSIVKSASDTTNRSSSHDILASGGTSSLLDSNEVNTGTIGISRSKSFDLQKAAKSNETIAYPSSVAIDEQKPELPAKETVLSSMDVGSENRQSISDESTNGANVKQLIDENQTQSISTAIVNVISDSPISPPITDGKEHENEIETVEKDRNEAMPSSPVVIIKKGVQGEAMETSEFRNVESEEVKEGNEV